MAVVAADCPVELILPDTTRCFSARCAAPEIDQVYVFAVAFSNHLGDYIKLFQIFGGTNQVQRNIVARALKA